MVSQSRSILKVDRRHFISFRTLKEEKQDLFLLAMQVIISQNYMNKNILVLTVR